MQDILHQLTNRGTGFIWARFPVDPYFEAVRLPDYAAEVRRDLGLDVETTDYYVLGALHGLLSSPWIIDDVGNPEDLQEVTFYPHPRTGWAGGTLESSSKGVAAFARVPTTWPVEQRITIEYVTAETARIRTGTQSWDVNAKLSPTPGYVILDWPEEFNAIGVINVSGTWVTGSVVEIDHQPTAYPYDQVVAYIAAKRATNQLLRDRGLASAWQGARSSIERVGLVASALIKTYRILC